MFGYFSDRIGVVKRHPDKAFYQWLESSLDFDKGGDVENLSVGDSVFGCATADRDGTHAEYVAINSTLLAIKPDRIDHVDMASLPIAALSAYAGLVTYGNLAEGEKVLIHAGAGGVGVIAVQLAKQIGATVVTTASESNAEYVRDLGADIVIDYRTTDFSKAVSDYDLVFDTMGGHIHLQSYAVLAPGGRMTYLNADPIPDKIPRDDVTVFNAPVNYDTEPLARIAELVENGAIKPQMVANMGVTRREVESAVVVPQDALVRVEDGYILYIVVGGLDGQVAEARAVELGPTRRNLVVIEKGVTGGEQLVVVGQRSLAHGDRVNVVESGE